VAIPADWRVKAGVIIADNLGTVGATTQALPRTRAATTRARAIFAVQPVLAAPRAGAASESQSWQSCSRHKAQAKAAAPECWMAMAFQGPMAWCVLA